MRRSLPGSGRAFAVGVTLVAALALAAPRVAALPTLPADLGPAVRVGLDVGSGAVGYATLAPILDPDLPPSAAPALTVTLEASAAQAAVDAAASLTTPPPVPAPVTALARDVGGAWFAALGPAGLVVLQSGLDAASAAGLAAQTPGAVALALGPAGESVIASTVAVPAASLAVARLVPSGALVGPYASLAAARRVCATLAGDDLWALPELAALAGAAAPGRSPGAAWYARVLGAATAPSRTAAAAAAVRAAQAALAGTAAGVSIVPVIGGGTSILAVAGGRGALAPAAWAIGAPGALSLSAGPAPAAPAAAYAGALIVSREGPRQGLDVVNDLPLERYVAGVVAREMPSTWPLAALEAQAIASRTYALWAIASRSATAPYVLTAGPADQVYGGLGAETAATNAATWATAGEVVTYDGAPIDAVYEADSGGYTANSGDVWGSALPYLIAEPEPRGYVSPHRWRIRLAASVLGADAAAAGSVTGVVDVLEIAAREAASGRVIDLLLGGPQGQARLVDDAVRTALGLPSTLFAVQTATEVSVRGASSTRTLLGLAGASVEGAQGERRVGSGGTIAIVGGARERALAAAPQSYLFEGRGDGPGLGMSQDGALFLAREGATASTILLYYYRGAMIEGDNGEGAP